MIFLCDEDDSTLSPFERLLKSIQKNFSCLYAIMNSFVEENPNRISCDTTNQIFQIVPVLRRTASLQDRTSHANFRCWSSRKFFELLISFDFIPDRPKTLTDISINEVSLGGRGFPDHTFILIEYDGVYYIMQSYYYAYIVAGKYGLIKLDETEGLNLKILLEMYTEAAKTGEDVSNMNDFFSNYTGIDAKQHAIDMAERRSPRSCTVVSKNISPDNFIINLFKNLAILYRHVDANPYPIDIDIFYTLYISFKDLIGDIEDTDTIRLQLQKLAGVDIDISKIAVTEIQGKFYLYAIHEFHGYFVPDNCLKILSDIRLDILSFRRETHR